MKKLTVFAALLAIPAIAANAPQPVVLTVDLAEGNQLKPGSAFELRFDQPMIAPELVGKATEAPIAIKPGIEGKWTWLSTQSGVFQPAAPAPLGTKYELTLHRGLKYASGKPFRASLKKTFASPGFAVKGWFAPDYINTEDATTTPRVSLLFNADVAPDEVAKNLWFINAAKLKVAAQAGQVDIRKTPQFIFPAHRSDDRNRLTWAGQFREHLAGGGKKRKPADEDEDEDAPAQPGGEAVLQNQVLVSPVNPLPPGEKWELVAGQGLVSTGGDKLSAPYHVEIGTVKAFGVTAFQPENLVYSGRRLTIRFTKKLGKAVVKEPMKWVKIEPAPANFKALVPGDAWEGRDTLVVTGDFEIGKDYAVTLSADTPAAETFTLGQPVTKIVSFAPVAARAYFQGFATHQQRAGTRQFHLMSVNVSKLRVSAKLVTPGSEIAAFDAWAKYYKEEGMDAAEWLQKVDPAIIPGTVVWQKEFAPGGVVDEKKLLALNWDEILGAGKTGTVLLTAEQAAAPAPNVKRVGTQALVQVTDLGVVWKDGADTFLHVFSLASAAPVAAASLRLLDETGALLADAKTAADGTARLPKKDGQKAKWLLVSNADDQHLVRFDYERGELDFGRFRVNVWGDEEDLMAYEDLVSAGKRRGFMFSDRPVYRPGETVHLKAIVRSYAPGTPSLPAGLAGRLVVKGPRNRLITEQKITLSDTGSLSADIQLPRETVGHFSAQVLFAGDDENDWSGVRHGWSVQEYAPNAFEVKVATPGTPRLAAPTEVALSGKYYMGKALEKATASWTVRASDEVFAPAGFEDFDFTNAIHDWRILEKLGGETRFSAAGKAVLGEGGLAKAAFTVPANPRFPQPRQVQFLCEITDINEQTVAERTAFTAHSSDFYLGIHRFPDVVREGEKLPLRVVAVRNDGTPLLERVNADVKLTRLDWQTNRVEEADEAENFRSEPLMQLIAQSPVQTAKLAQKGSKWSPEGAPDTSLTVEKPGLYLVTAVARDSAGRDVITTTTVYVFGKDQLAWNYRNRFQVELESDKPEYRIGEQATILVKTPISGPALVTVERENVRRHFFTKLEGNAPAVRVPIEEGDGPNIFVSVLLLRGSQDSPKKFKAPEYRIGYTQLRIARPDAKLYVNVKPQHPQVRPGDQQTVTCEVRDVDGKPVAGAEVTLWAADEGVLSLTGFETPDPLEFFSKLLRLDVVSGITLERLLGEDPDERAFENKGYLVGGFGKGLEAGVRRNFLGTAHWAGALKTGVDGNATVTFKAPDGLTRYRVMAVAHTKRDQFGHAESAFEINKPFMLEPSPPRFANVGDQMLIRAVLHNTTAAPGEAEVRVKLDATAAAFGATDPVQKITVPAGATVAVDFPIAFRATGEAVWTWTADFTAGATKFRDAVETRFKVVHPTPLLREIVQSRPEGDADLLAGLDPALLAGKGTVRVGVANSRIFELREGVSELLHYPYGCLEQTTSALLPWLTLREFRDVLPELGRLDADYDAAIEKSITRLLSMQTSTGGLGFWPGSDSPEVWSSAYGGLGLALARRAGHPVPEYEAGRVFDYLSKQLRGAADTGDKWQLSERAFACHTLAVAGRAEPAYHELLYKKRDKLTQESRAFLALAILEAGGSAKMAETLLKMRDKAVEEDFWFGCIARAQGIRLLAWSRLAPKSDGTTAVANAVFDLRKNGSWVTTQGNVWAVMGLAEYIRKTEAGRKAAKGSIVQAGEATGFQLPAKGGFFEKEYPLDVAAKLLLKNPAKSRFFTQVTLATRPDTLITERKDRGYSIARRYQRIADDGTLADLGEPRTGDRVLVTISFTAPGNASYMVIDDPLPAVFEAVNPEFKSQAMAGQALSNTWASDYSELRDDRALFFRNTIWPGKHEIRYLARVRAAGAATAPPTKIEEMYHPDRFGLAGSQIVRAKAQ